MPAKNKQTKAPKGTVGVEKFRGKFRLRLPRQIFGGKQKYISTGLEDTPENWKRVQSKAWAIEEDIATGNFDPTLAKYRPQTHLSLAKSCENFIVPLNLNELWEKYTEFKSTQVEETTLRLNFNRVASHINKFPTKLLKDSTKIRDYLVSNNSPYTAKRILMQINACCNWAVKSGLIESNPFPGMVQEIKSPKNSSNGVDIDPFTAQERDIIINAFREHPIYHHYTSFVRFLFMTGCRTSEAVALKWKHINSDCSKITFLEAVVSVSSQKIRKGLKTEERRDFPCNKSLQSLLLSIRPENYNNEDLVFPSVSGKEINSHTFNAFVWKGSVNKGKRYIGIVQGLADEGKIERYRSQYQTRHTFITLALENGLDVKDVARLVGNSPEIIYKHYAGRKRDLVVPEF